MLYFRQCFVTIRSDLYLNTPAKFPVPSEKDCTRLPGSAKCFHHLWRWLLFMQNHLVPIYNFFLVLSQGEEESCFTLVPFVPDCLVGLCQK